MDSGCMQSHLCYRSKSDISYLTLLNSLLFLADLGSLVTSASLTSSPDCGGLEAIPAWSECSGSVRVSGWESDMAPDIHKYSCEHC